MALNGGTTSPLDITPRMSNSNSPRGQTSNLTSALQEASFSTSQISFPQHVNDFQPPFTNPQSDLQRNDSSTNMFGASYYGNGARPISMRERQRRESNNAAGSFMGGMSWGASSINGGDWLREDVMMAGTSPSTFHQPSSFQSSSYLPKMEASYFKDYWCCGICHASLHDLMQHVEVAHPSDLDGSQFMPGAGIAGAPGFPLAPPSGGPVSTGSDKLQTPASQSTTQGSRGFQNNSSQAKPSLATIQDDPLDNMDFDESAGANASAMGMQSTMAQQAFRPTNAPVAASSQPFSFFSSNPTVSSVNTPTLSTNSLNQKTSPDSSIPSTPHAANITNLDSSLNMFNGIDMSGMPAVGDDYDFNINFGMPGNMGGLTIHDPARQLSSKNGGLDASQVQFAINNGQMPGEGDAARGLQQPSFPGGVPQAALGFPGHEEKKYKCPVIGCEKAYKNQNGLKYHKQHGHTNQQLKQNADGSFSIVDPLTCTPYPGTIGMEKEKPYRCEKCGKRYKNLNGLKYHRQHSPPCNPELQNQMVSNMPGLISLQQIQQNVPQAGMI